MMTPEDVTKLKENVDFSFYKLGFINLIGLFNLFHESSACLLFMSIILIKKCFYFGARDVGRVAFCKHLLGR